MLFVVPLALNSDLPSLVPDFLRVGRVADAYGQTDSIQTVALLEASPALDPSSTSSLIDTQIVGGGSLLSDSGPTGAAADISTSTFPTSDQISVYTVRRGDTISGIAEMFNVSVNTIYWSNNLKKGQSLKGGQSLVILPISGIQYTIKKGDTLASILRKYGGDRDEVLAFNNLESDKLIVGTSLIIPDGEVSSVVSQKVVTTTGGKKVVSGGSLPSYSGYYAWPATGGRKSQGLHGHNGIDVAGSFGMSILASAPGTVLIARDGGYNGGYGSYVVIKHSNGTQTLYGHLSAVKVNVGQSVERGQVIGAMGSTGRSTGIHVHFEVRGAKNPF